MLEANPSLWAIIVLEEIQRCHPDRNLISARRRLQQRIRAMRANFKNGLRPVGKEIEVLFLRRAGAVRDSVYRIMFGLWRCTQGERPGRNYSRESKQPGSKSTRRGTA